MGILHVGSACMASCMLVLTWLEDSRLVCVTSSATTFLHRDNENLCRFKNERRRLRRGRLVILKWWFVCKTDMDGEGNR